MGESRYITESTIGRQLEYLHCWVDYNKHCLFTPKGANTPSKLNKRYKTRSKVNSSTLKMFAIVGLVEISLEIVFFFI